MFFTLFACWVWRGGVSPKVLVYTTCPCSLPMQFVTLGSSKIEVSETYFLDMMTTYNLPHPPRTFKNGCGT